jgi:hypothetical protein
VKYTGYTPVKSGDKIALLDEHQCPYLEAKVVDALAKQFTIRVKKQTRFFFYEDRGLTWAKLD